MVREQKFLVITHPLLPAVEDRNPLFEAVLWGQTLPEMPFPDVGRAVVGVVRHLRQTAETSRKWRAVSYAPGHVRPRPRQQGRARRCAERMGHIGALKNGGLGGQLVQIRCNFSPRPITSNRVGTLLVRQKDD